MEDSRANDHKPYISNTGLLERYHRRGQLFEILAVIAVAGAICLGVFKYDSTWILLLAVLVFVSGLVSLYFAVVFASKAAAAARDIAAGTRYAVTGQRIRTLEIVEAPEDALEALKTIRPDHLLTEEELIGKLVDELGAARTNEIKEIVLKYTRVDKNDRIANSTANSAAAAPENIPTTKAMTSAT